MVEIGRLLILIGVGALGLTLLGAAVVWSMDERRTVRRGLRKVLGEEPHALLVARGRGRGVGFNFSTNRLAVAWDAGAWCLVYFVDELIGAELIVDGQVIGRVHRGEARRAVDAYTAANQFVRLRLVFSDPAYPDFDLDLWTAEDDGRRGALTSAEAVQEANRWLARTEALLRRAIPRRMSPVVAPAPLFAQEPETAQPEPANPDSEDDGSLTV